MSAKFPRGGGGANPFSAIRLLSGAMKQCLLDTVRVSEKTWQVIVQTRRP